MAGRTLFSFAIVALTYSLSVSGCIWPICSWHKCNYTEVQGAYCKDCNTQAICTKIGEMVRPCLWPGKSNCVDGQCQAAPSVECAPTPEPPTEASEPPTEASEPPTEASETPTEASEPQQGSQDGEPQANEPQDQEPNNEPQSEDEPAPEEAN